MKAYTSVGCYFSDLSCTSTGNYVFADSGLTSAQCSNAVLTYTTGQCGSCAGYNWLYLASTMTMEICAQICCSTNGYVFAALNG